MSTVQEGANGYTGSLSVKASFERKDFLGSFCMRGYQGEQRMKTSCLVKQGTTGYGAKWHVNTLKGGEVVVSFSPIFEPGRMIATYDITLLPPVGDYPSEGIIRRVNVVFKYLGSETELDDGSLVPNLSVDAFQLDENRLERGVRGVSLARYRDYRGRHLCCHGEQPDRVKHFYLGAFRTVNIPLSERMQEDPELPSHHDLVSFQDPAEAQRETDDGRYTLT